jgi:predicted PurR-regulated permease PerM
MNSIRGWLIGVAVVAGAVLIWDVLSGAMSALLLLFTAMLIAAGLRPIVDRMAKRMPYGAAVGLAFVALIAIVIVIGAVLVQPLGAELVKLVQSLPGYASALQTQLVSVQRHFENDQTARQIAGALAGSAGSAASAIGAYLLSGTASAVGAFGNGVLILLLAVGWMLSSDELSRFVLGLMPPAVRTRWSEAFDDIATRLSAYVGGVVINGSIVGVVMGISLALLGAPYYLLLGFIAAIFQAIPMLGAVISGPIILLVVLATSGWSKMLIALAIFAVVQIVDQNVLSPIIFGQRVQLSFLLIILATVVGGTLLGIGGAFLAVPAAAVLQVLVVRIVAPAIRGAQEQKASTQI